MQYWTKPLLFCLTTGLLLLLGCSKPSELGLSLVELNPSEVYTTDSLSLNMTTEPTAPLPTYGRSRWLCGSYSDPIFGQTAVSIYTNFRLTSTNASFPNATFDSLVLSIAYDSIGHYGGDLNNLMPQTWEVYRITESIEPNIDYTSDVSFALGELLGTTTFTPNFSDSLTIQGESKSPHLRIRLSDTFARMLMNPSTEIYENNSTFKSFFKGICIKPAGTANNSTILRFLPKAAETKLSLYYKNSLGTAQTFEFLTDNDSESALAIEHDYSGVSIFDNNLQDSIVHIQGMNGPSIRVEIPELNSLGQIIVNRAELRVYVSGEEDLNYPVLDQLFCSVKTSSGDYALVDDITTSVSRNSRNPFLQFGGLLTEDNTVRYFSMNLSEFLQKIVDQELNENAFYIQPATVTDSERMTLYTNNNNNPLRAKLYLTYTKTN